MEGESLAFEGVLRSGTNFHALSETVTGMSEARKWKLVESWKLSEHSQGVLHPSDPVEIARKAGLKPLDVAERNHAKAWSTLDPLERDWLESEDWDDIDEFEPKPCLSSMKEGDPAIVAKALFILRRGSESAHLSHLPVGRSRGSQR